VNVKRVDTDSRLATAPFSGGPEQEGEASRLDSFERPGYRSEIGSLRVIREPDVVTSMAGVAAAQNAEAIMVTDARAQKLAAIEKRIQDGVYNTRQSIERVVDRLLDKWHLGSPRIGQEPGK